MVSSRHILKLFHNRWYEMIMQLPPKKKKHIILTQFCVQPPKKKHIQLFHVFFGSNPPKKNKNPMLGNCQFPYEKWKHPEVGEKNNPSTTAITGVCWGHLAKLRLQQGLVNTLRRERHHPMIGWCFLVIFFGRNDENPKGFCFRFDKILGDWT